MLSNSNPTDSISVCIRIKPSDREDQSSSHIQISTPRQLSITTKRNKSSKMFTYNSIFSQSSTQSTIYNDMCKEYISQFLSGFNCTIFAYGQTSSGKTYTSGLNDQTIEDESHQGIASRAILDVFSQLLDVDYQLKITFFELYQEKIRDLISDSSEGIDYTIREDGNGQISVIGLVEKSINSVEEALELLKLGSMNRTIGETKMSIASSRSHAIFTLNLEKRSVSESQPNFRNLHKSKLHLVDLAGSERLKKTGAEGVRFRESIKINSSLLVLGNVINALSENKTAPHIPYRDSKLTRLLQDSLGGNAKTLMIACINSNVEDIDETLNTLEYAQRTRKIINKPTKTVSVSSLVSEKAESVFELLGDSEEEIEFKKIFSLMKRKSSRITEANERIRLLEIEVQSAREQVLKLESSKEVVHVGVSVSNQTDTLKKSDSSQSVESISRQNASRVVDLSSMHTLTPLIIMNHMYSSVELLEDDEQDIIVVQNEQKLLKQHKVDLAKSSSKLHKDMEKLKQSHSEEVIKIDKEVHSKEREIQGLIDRLDQSQSDKSKTSEQYERKLKLLETQVHRLKSAEKDKQRIELENKNLEKRNIELEASVKRNAKFDGKKGKKDDNEDLRFEFEALNVKYLGLLNENAELQTKTSTEKEEEKEVYGKCNETCTQTLKELKVKLKSTIHVNNKLVVNITKLREDLKRYKPLKESSNLEITG